MKKNIGEGSATMEEVDDLNFMVRLKEIKTQQNKENATDNQQNKM